MRIGLDFDNSIVCYDQLFHRLALADAGLDDRVPARKIAVRDTLRAQGREEQWTRLQGLAYGPHILEATAYPGAIDVIASAKRQQATLFIISHRTRHPALGPAYDLHAAARRWISHHLTVGSEVLIPEGQIFFETSKADKLARIAACRCDLFLDDLPEILLAADFPAPTRRVLFDPDRHHATAGLLSISHWRDLPALLTP